VRTADGKSLADPRMLVRDLASRTQGVGRAGENTTIGVVATNAALTKVQATKVAQMAHDGIARAIYPSHTMSDGDAIFALATGTRTEAADVSLVGALAADMMSEAILRAVRASKGLPGYPAVRDLAKP
jgi:L-aminopeptidase/D-esterase-like protein